MGLAANCGSDDAVNHRGEGLLCSLLSAFSLRRVEVFATTSAKTSFEYIKTNDFWSVSLMLTHSPYLASARCAGASGCSTVTAN